MISVYQKIIDHIFIVSTIFFTVYSQLIMRWQVSNAGSLPSDHSDKLKFIFSLLVNPWVISGIFSTFLAGVSWMLAMTKFDISYAFPFVSLNYIIILFAGVVIYHEPINLMKIIGSLIVVIGIIVLSKG